LKKSTRRNQRAENQRGEKQREEINEEENAMKNNEKQNSLITLKIGIRFCKKDENKMKCKKDIIMM
jgi:hypothetical protein